MLKVIFYNSGRIAHQSEIEIVLQRKFSSPPCTKFTITIPYSETKKFELRLLRAPPIGLIEGIGKDRGWERQEYCFYFDPECEDSSALEYLAEYMGERIKSVELRNNIGPTVSTLLRGKRIAELTMFGEQLSEVSVNSLLQMCSSNTIAHLVLHVIGFANNDPGEVLLNIASHIPSLKIIHSDKWKIDPQLDIHCLFGVSHVDWAPTIIEMFERKIEMLNIMNQWTSGYLSRKSADLLIKKLPLLEKKFWFETSCEEYDEGLSYERNGCYIRADSSDNHGQFLRTRRLTITNRNDIPYY